MEVFRNVKLVLNDDGRIAKATFDAARDAMEDAREEAVDRLIATLGPLKPAPGTSIRLQLITTINLTRE